MIIEKPAVDDRLSMGAVAEYGRLYEMDAT